MVSLLQIPMPKRVEATPLHPYLDLPPRAFWKTAVANPGADGIADLGECRVRLRPTDAIATAGSCFAQHIARRLRQGGFNYIDAEPPPLQLPQSQWHRFGYDLFSARYGNIYTSAQLLQLLRRATRSWKPAERVWETEGRWYDPFRPAIEPDGFASEGEALLAQESHLHAVRAMLAKIDVFIFTLGLTEAWRSREDGAVYPICPGVSAGRFDPSRHEFVNLDYGTILEEMEAALAILRGLRPNLRILLTVSPVPLTATAAGGHVLTATTYSKSVLRAVAGRLTELHDWVDYFPSYELVTAPVFRGRAYEPNFRAVASTGVDFVMETFLREYCDASSPASSSASSPGAVPAAEAPTEGSAEARAQAKLQARRERRRKRRLQGRPGDDELVCEEMALQAFAK